MLPRAPPLSSQFTFNLSVSQAFQVPQASRVRISSYTKIECKEVLLHYWSLIWYTRLVCKKETRYSSGQNNQIQGHTFDNLSWMRWCWSEIVRLWESVVPKSWNHHQCPVLCWRLQPHTQMWFQGTRLSLEPQCSSEKCPQRLGTFFRIHTSWLGTFFRIHTSWLGTP